MPDSSQAIINCCDGLVGWMKFGLMYNMMAMSQANAAPPKGHLCNEHTPMGSQGINSPPPCGDHKPK
jgi:hypothetical protein